MVASANLVCNGDLNGALRADLGQGDLPRGSGCVDAVKPRSDSDVRVIRIVARSGAIGLVELGRSVGKSISKFTLNGVAVVFSLGVGYCCRSFFRGRL